MGVGFVAVRDCWVPVLGLSNRLKSGVGRNVSKIALFVNVAKNRRKIDHFSSGVNADPIKHILSFDIRWFWRGVAHKKKFDFFQKKFSVHLP